MKTRLTIIFVVLAIVAGTISSCKKYEEDYGVMTKSPQKRLVGEWKLTQLSNDTMTIKFSDFAMFGEMHLNFEKNGTGTAKFVDKGLADALGDFDWQAMLEEYGSTADTTINADEIGNLDFASILSQESGFNWEFNDDKTYIIFKPKDGNAGESLEMKILSLCNTDAKFANEKENEKFTIELTKLK